jgi:hypothetical protein
MSKLKAGESITITFTLSEASPDFTKDDVSVLGGVLSDIILKFGETKVYTATFTPTANSTTTGTILVASDKFSDAAGNTNVDGADANNSVFLTIDTKVPTIAISSDTDKLKTGESTTITFTLSEVSTDFDATDVVVTGGILTDLSTAFGTLVSIIKNTELFASAPSTLILPAASLNLSLATEIVPAVTLLSVGVKVAI